jgi:hypothetical protein
MSASQRRIVLERSPSLSMLSLRPMISSTMAASHAARSASLLPKWCMTRAALTPALAAIARTLVPSKPCAPNSASAACRMRARVVRSGLGERMFSILNACSNARKGEAASAAGADRPGLSANAPPTPGELPARSAG